MSIENKISLLWNCALALKSDQQTHKILKSYYVNTCRSLSRNSLLLPKEKLATSQMCSHCGYFWYEGKFRTKSIPKRTFNNSAKRLIEKLEKNNSTENGTPLNKSQRKRAKWLKKCLSKRLEITCENCNRKSTIEMEIPKNKSVNNKQQFVKTDWKTSLNSNNKSDKKSQKNSIGQNLVSQKLKTDTSQQKTTSSKELKVQSEGKKNKKKNITATKVISKTQSQNNLLQLAALLKKNPQQVNSKAN
ncbi:hypothetical protein DOY81_011327, partial [Sarcophaga bullata]